MAEAIEGEEMAGSGGGGQGREEGEQDGGGGWGGGGHNEGDTTPSLPLPLRKRKVAGGETGVSEDDGAGGSKKVKGGVRGVGGGVTETRCGRSTKPYMW